MKKLKGFCQTMFLSISTRGLTSDKARQMIKYSITESKGNNLDLRNYNLSFNKQLNGKA